MSDSNGTVVAKERKLGEKCIASPYLKIRRCLKVRNSVSQSIDSNDCDMLAGKSTEKVNVTVSEKPLQIRAVSGTLRRVFPLISCFVVCMLIALGATNSKFTFVAVLVSCIIACLTSIIGSKQSNYLLCISVMILLFMQNLCIGLGAHYSGNISSSLSYLTQIPFLYIAVIWFGFELKKITSKSTLSQTQKSFIAVILCIFISLIFGRGSFQAIAITIRNLTVFFMAYEIGGYSLKNWKSVASYSKFLVLSGLVLTSLGEIILLGGYPLNRFLGIHEVYIAKGSPFEYGRLDGRFYTTLISKQYERMGSIYFEPINLAYVLSAALLVSIFVPIYKDGLSKIIVTTLLGIGLIQTVGKGGYLLVVFILCCVGVEKIVKFFSSHAVRRYSRRRIVFFMVAGVVAFILLYVKFIGAAIMPHIWGITRTWGSVLRRPWGYGVGTGGNAAQILNDDASSWFDSGGETALMSFMYQIGIQGIIAFLTCVISTRVQYKHVRKYPWMSMFYYLPFALVGVSLMQDNTFTPQCVVVFMLLQGGINSMCGSEDIRVLRMLEEGSSVI